jgi:hypothetical protein
LQLRNRGPISANRSKSRAKNVRPRNRAQNKARCRVKRIEWFVAASYDFTLSNAQSFLIEIHHLFSASDETSFC